MSRLTYPDGSRRECIGGFEQEYSAGIKVAPGVEEWYRQPLLSTVTKSGHFGFDDDGSRNYIDVGDHPERANAEDTDFMRIAYRVIEGHIKTVAIYRSGKEGEATHNPAISKIFLGTNTTDFGSDTWGYHLNTIALRTVPLINYAQGLIAHHASRIIWSANGAPQLIPEDGEMKQVFCLSERAEHIWETISLDTTQSRPLMNTRDEPLANDGLYRRIHDVSCEPVFSPYVNALLVASESIISRATELGVDFGNLVPKNPIRAMRMVSHDPDMKTKIELVNGKKVTGPELQKLIAERAIKATLGADYLTTQEKEWAGRWIEIIDAVNKDSNDCIHQLDWVLKRHHLEREKPVAAMSEAEFKKAQVKGYGYHQLLPSEGIGMRALRKGFFELSPDMEQLEKGLPLPNTRAAVRGKFVKAAKAAGGCLLGTDWDRVRVRFENGESGGWTGERTFLLNDPYKAQDDSVDAYVENVLAPIITARAA